MLSKCIYLFLAMIPLIIIANEVSEYFNSYAFKFEKNITKRKKLKYPFTVTIYSSNKSSGLPQVYRSNK